jgi:ubiquinone/menaquinone biosynthesis C-methylase UbiE
MLAWWISGLSLFLSWLYDTLISHNLTSRTYARFFKNLARAPKEMLDVGVGTGLPLMEVLPLLGDCQVTGLDIDRHYVAAARERFAGQPSVRILEQDITSWQTHQKFEMVLFSFSFMLIPDRKACLARVREMVTAGGEVVFFLTLEKGRSVLKERVKPWLKYLTSVDFGQIVYRNDFFRELEEEGLELIDDEVMTGSWLFTLVEVHVVRARFR